MAGNGVVIRPQGSWWRPFTSAQSETSVAAPAALRFTYGSSSLTAVSAKSRGQEKVQKIKAAQIWWLVKVSTGLVQPVTQSPF